MISSLSKNSGGWLRTQYIGKALSQAGHQVRFVDPLNYALPKSLDFIFSIPGYLFQTLKTPADIVIGTKPFPNVIICLLIKKWLGAFTVLDIDDYDAGFGGPMLGSLFSRFVRLFPRRFHLITTHNLRLKKFIRQKYQLEEGRIYLLEQGVSDLFFPPAEKRVVDWQTQEWIEKGYRILLYTAHLNSASDADAILDAFKIVIRTESKARLVVVGDGVMRRGYQQYAKQQGLTDYVHFVGRVPKEKIPAYLEIAELCLVYYKDIKTNLYRESMKLREYLAFGKPVVCNRVGYLADFADYTYQTENNATAFGSVIQKFLTDNRFRDGREQKGQHFVQRRFSWKTLGERFSNELLKRVNS